MLSSTKPGDRCDPTSSFLETDSGSRPRGLISTLPVDLHDRFSRRIFPTIAVKDRQKDRQTYVLARKFQQRSSSPAEDLFRTPVFQQIVLLQSDFLYREPARLLLHQTISSKDSSNKNVRRSGADRDVRTTMIWITHGYSTTSACRLMTLIVRRKTVERLSAFF